MSTPESEPPAKKQIDQTVPPAAAPAATLRDTVPEGWDPYDEYDCRDNEPKQSQAYIDETMPWLKDALAKRRAELEAAALPATPEAVAKKA